MLRKYIEENKEKRNDYVDISFFCLQHFKAWIYKVYRSIWDYVLSWKHRQRFTARNNNFTDKSAV